jgi:hypothetical protein
MTNYGYLNLNLDKRTKQEHIDCLIRRMTMNALYPFAMTLFTVGCIAAVSALLHLVRD